MLKIEDKTHVFGESFSCELLRGKTACSFKQVTGFNTGSINKGQLRKMIAELTELYEVMAE